MVVQSQLSNQTATELTMIGLVNIQIDLNRRGVQTDDTIDMFLSV